MGFDQSFQHIWQGILKLFCQLLSDYRCTQQSMIFSLSEVNVFIIQMIQKKKGTSQPTKKLNRVKSEEFMPIGTLVQEIGQLKEELRVIKKGRKLDTTSKTIKAGRPNQNKQNWTKKELNQDSCGHLSQQIKLKVEILWGRLCKGLDLTDGQKVKRDVQEIIQIFNWQTAESQYEIEQLKRQIQEMELIRGEQKKIESEKCWIIGENNKRLEAQVEELKGNTFVVLKEKDKRFEDLFVENENLREMVEQLKSQVQQMTKTNLELEELIEEWEVQCKNLQDKCSILDKNLNSRDHDAKLLEEDVKYLRIQSEKFKSQKKQLEKLWEKSSVDLRQFKRAFEDEVVKAQREKNKWMNQCELRRHQSQQIQGIESQKEILFKQVQDLRNKYSLKCKQLSETKALLHEVQRKFISLEGDNFRMSNQLEKTQRENGYWQTEIVKLRKQFQQFTGIPEKKSARKEDSGRKLKEQKIKALDDIHSLIKQYRTDDVL